MDFGIVYTTHEKNEKYVNSEDVFKDVQYIWDNCYKYNKVYHLERRAKGHYDPINSWQASVAMKPLLSLASSVPLPLLSSPAQESVIEDFKGSKWLMLRYAVLNLEATQAAIHLAKQQGLLVSLDLASFEMVRNFKTTASKAIGIWEHRSLLCKWDDAAELLRGEQNADTEAAMEFLSRYCQQAVITLGSNGCIAKHGKEVTNKQRVPNMSRLVAATSRSRLVQRQERNRLAGAGPLEVLSLNSSMHLECTNFLMI